MERLDQGNGEKAEVAIGVQSEPVRKQRLERERRNGIGKDEG